MRTLCWLLILTHILFPAKAQLTNRQVYAESAPRINDLVHTKLEVSFDYSKTSMSGSAWITLKPHFYPTDSLDLDAKQMEIDEVSLINKGHSFPVKYEYDGWHLRIKLDRTYSRWENYTVYIKYISRPDKAKVDGSEKGLYFINHDGKQEDKPVQIWTDCEPEKVSMWCPTIDKPDQKTTEEISMTVPEKYVTLSNGKLISQIKNKDGSRTDHWKMDLPHAPYLFFMAVGDFSVVKDNYKGKEVSYYVEPKYAKVARRIFGETPAMMAFFERITGVPFPWVKYSQIVLRDFTSTAMENTTATAHAEGAQQDSVQLIDGNIWENNIAHELFHQWFGDYVTCEKWSDLTLNESFARYGEYLWLEHKYGSDAAREEMYEQLKTYLNNSSNETKPLVRTSYTSTEELFDDISYGKGSIILNMLRNDIGDSAFFRGINLYLTSNRFKSVEVSQLRLALEEVSGRDLTGFFNQWYYRPGHPKVKIDYLYNDAQNKGAVVITQTQGVNHLFEIPLTIDIYNGTTKASLSAYIRHEKDTFSFTYPNRPNLVNVDPDKLILWDKEDNKTLENFWYQYNQAGNYVDRLEAVAASLRQWQNPLAASILKKGLTDKSAALRRFCLNGLNIKNDSIRQSFGDIIVSLAKNDTNSTVRGLAIRALGDYPNKDNEQLLISKIHDPSSYVSGEALAALRKVDSTVALAEAKRMLNTTTSGKLSEEIVITLAEFDAASNFDIIADRYAILTFKPRIARSFGNYLARIQDKEQLKKGVTILVRLREAWPYYKTFINENILTVLLRKKQAARLQDQADFIKENLPD